MIPENKRVSVEKALRETFGVGEADEISLLTGGLSTALIYRIGVRGEACVLRIVLRSGGIHDAAREFACVRAASEAGIAPELLYANATDGVSISRLIEARPPVGVAVVPQLVRMIKQVHELPLFPAADNHLENVDVFICRGKESGLLPAASVAAYVDLYEEIRRAYPGHDPDLVSSHNDLNPTNILFDGTRFWFVDWEAAFAGDRYADLATIANYFVYSDEAEEELLRGYFGDSADDYHRARLFLMRQVCHLCCGMVFLQLASTTKPADVETDAEMKSAGLSQFYGMLRAGQVALGSYEGQLLYAKVLLNEALRMGKLPRFEESIVRVQKA